MIICIDAGHTPNVDPGACANGLKEVVLAGDICDRVITTLAPYDADVRLVPRTDDLSARCDYANTAGADCFISVHINAGGGTGFESFVHPNAGDRSLELRDIIHKRVSSFYSSAGFRDRGQKSANFAVLRLTRMPALLLENLFIDTAGDAGKLADPAFRQQIAEAITAGLAEALGLRRAADPVTDAIQTLCRAGVIASPDYWVRNARPGKVVDGEFAGMLLQNMAKFIKGE